MVEVSHDALLTTIPVVLAITATLPSLLVKGQGKYHKWNVVWLFTTMTAFVAAFVLAPFQLTAAFWTTVGGMASSLVLFMRLVLTMEQEENAREPDGVGSEVS